MVAGSQFVFCAVVSFAVRDEGVVAAPVRRKGRSRGGDEEPGQHHISVAVYMWRSRLDWR